MTRGRFFLLFLLLALGVAFLWSRPSEVRARLLLTGDRLYLAKQFDQAQGIYLEASRMGSRDAQIFSRLGMVATAKGDFATAEAAFRQGLALQSDCFGCLAGLCEVLASSGRWQEARVFAIEWLKLQPYSQEALLFLARSAKEQGDLQQAKVWLARSLDINPSYHMSHLMLSDIRATEKDWPAVIREGRLAVGQNQKIDAQALYRVGVGLVNLGDSKGALSALQWAVNFDNRLPEAHLALGILRLSEQPDAARQHLQNYLMLVPDGPQADQVRSWLGPAKK